MVLNRAYRGLAAFFLVGAMLTWTHIATAVTVGPVTDDIGVVKIPKGAPIQIGGTYRTAFDLLDRVNQGFQKYFPIS